MSIDSLNNIKTALTKLDKTQSLIKGIRLGISTISSSQSQNVEEILKLINLDLFEISSIISDYIENKELELSQQIENIESKENSFERDIQTSAVEIFTNINQNFGNEINNDNN